MPKLIWNKSNPSSHNPAIAFLLLAAAIIPATAQHIIPQTPLPNLSNPGSAPERVIPFNDRLLVVASGARCGVELFQVDPDSGRTELLCDIEPGPEGSQPSGFFVFNEHVLFTARTTGAGLELWRTDGTPDGTHIVREIIPGPRGSNLLSLCAFGDGLLFRADSREHGDELWFSDGTAEGTVLVRDLVEGPMGSGIVRTVSAGARAYFRADVGNAVGQIWTTTGTAVSTRPVGVHGTRSAAGLLVPLGKNLISDCFTESSGLELWIIPASGAPFAVDLNPGPADSAPSEAMILNDILYFQAKTESAGAELWRSDGTRQGTFMVKDIAPGPTSSDPFNFTPSGDWLYFSANDGTTGRELWRTDGTEAGTHLVGDLWQGPKEGTPYNLVPFNDGLAFTAGDGVHGEELWYCAPSGDTYLVRDIYPGTESAAPHHGAVLHGKLYFGANDGIHGEELWVSDGTREGTRLLADIALPPEPAPASNPFHLTALDGRCVFYATGAEQATMLYVSDGTGSGTRPLLPPLNVEPATLTKFVAMNDALYALGVLQNGGLALIRTRGSAEESWVRTVDIPDVRSVQSCALAAGPEYLAIHVRASDGKSTLARCDLDGNNLAVLAKVSGPAIPETFEPPVPWLDTIFFAAGETASGVELWRVAPAGGEPELVADLVPGAGSSTPRELTMHNEHLYFVADGRDGPKLWMLEQPHGTPSALEFSPPVKPTAIRSLCSSPCGLLFVASNATHGTELWRVDETQGTAGLLKDIFPGIAGSHPADLVPFQQYVYFAADDMNLGMELWRTDGTSVGTAMVADAYAGHEGSAPAHLTAGRTMLVASMRGLSTAGVLTGHELFVIGGADTRGEHKEIRVGPESTYPQSFCIAGSRVYFTADDGVTSRELWVWEEPNAFPRLVKDILGPIRQNDAETGQH